MKAPSETQVTILLGIVGIGLLYYGVKKVSDAFGGGITKVGEVVNDVVIVPVKAVVKAVGDIATQEHDGATFTARYEPQDLVLQGLTGKKYAEPLVNNDGVDFGQLSG